MIRRLFIALLCFAAFAANAALTPAQLATLKAYIAADPTLNSQPQGSDGASVVATMLNVTATPSFWVWRTDVTRADIYHTTSADGTTFDWTTYKNQSLSEQGAWVQMFTGDTANFALPNLRAGVLTIFSGTGAPAVQRTHILTIGRRLARIVEKVLATGTGSTASPAVMTFEGPISYIDVQAARES